MAKKLCVVTVPATITVLVEVKDSDSDKVVAAAALEQISNLTSTLPGILQVVGDSKVVAVPAGKAADGKAKASSKDDEEEEEEDDEEEEEEDDEEEEEEDDEEEEEEDDEEEETPKKGAKSGANKPDKKSSDGKIKIKMKSK